jgi:hypothetical protein
LECGGNEAALDLRQNHECHADPKCRRGYALPAQLTHWNSSPILSFDWSRDGKWLAYASGSLTSDVILITDAGH